MKYANILSSICIGVLCGIAFNSFLDVNFLGVFFILCLSIFGGLLFYQNGFCRNFSILLVGFCIGIFIYQNASDEILNKKFVVPEDKINLVGIVDNVDKRSNGKVFLVVDDIEKLEYPVRVSLYNEYREFSVGDKINLYGQLKVPEPFNGFDYRGYLAKEGIAYIMIAPGVNILLQETSIQKNILSVKDGLSDGLYSMLPSDSSALYNAMLLGNRGYITEDIQENLRNSGIAHIVAISGLHIAILFGIVLFLLMLLPIHKSLAGLVAVVFIALYIFMIDAPASSVRAGLMLFSIFTASFFGRPSSAFRALLLVATIMALFNPLVLRYDVGFQLSFVAVISILLSLKFAKRRYLNNSWVEKIKSFLIISVSVYLGTLPLIFIHFDNVAEWGILANILVVPLLPLILIIGLLTSFLGVMGLPAIFSAPAYSLSYYVLSIGSIFST